MRTVLVVFLAVGCLVPTGSGQGIRYDNEVAIPTLSTVKLSPQVRRRIESVIFDGWKGDAATRHEIEENTEIRHQQLGPNKQWAWAARGYGDWCGAHDNCSIWFFDPVTGSSLLEDGNGQDFNVTAKVHKGHYDVEISYVNGCCNGGRAIYQFDGRQYRLVRNIEETLGAR